MSSTHAPPQAGPPSPTDPPTVLVAERGPDVRDPVAARLPSEYDVRAVTAETAVADALAGDEDVVLFDRRPRGTYGGEVVSRVRDRTDAVVAAVAGTDHADDLVGVPLDDYLERPAAREPLPVLLDRLARVSRYRRAMDRYVAAATREATPGSTADAAGPTDATDDDGPRHRRALEIGLAARRAGFDAADYDALFRAIGAGERGTVGARVEG